MSYDQQLADEVTRLREVAADRDQLRFDLHHQKEVYAGAVLTVERLTAERNALKAERDRLQEQAEPYRWAERDELHKQTMADNERLRAECERLKEKAQMGDRYIQKMTPDMRKQADAFNAKLGQTGEMLGAEGPEQSVAVAESGSTLGETRAQLTELCEAAQAHCAMVVHHAPEHEEGIRNRLLDSRSKLRAVAKDFEAENNALKAERGSTKSELIADNERLRSELAEAVKANAYAWSDGFNSAAAGVSGNEDAQLTELCEAAEALAIEARDAVVVLRVDLRERDAVDLEDAVAVVEAVLGKVKP